MADSTDSLAELYRAKDLIEAELIQTALADAGLTARLEGEYLGMSQPLGFRTDPRIMVKADELDRAREILKELLSPATGEEM